MPFTTLNNALGTHILTQLRSIQTPPEKFRTLARALTYLLVAEAARTLETVSEEVQTPLETMSGSRIGAKIVLAPVLRAGLGMLEPALELLPEASVGYVGLERDEATALARSYYCKLPDLNGATAILLDPMLATGGSAAWAAGKLYEAGAAEVVLLCIVAAPEGAARLEADFPALKIVAAALDRELNDKSYILPGLGDFGDRLYGTF